MSDDHKDDEDIQPELSRLLAPDNPLVDGTSEYTVRLVHRVNANSPEHARARFVALTNNYGLNGFIYRVTDELLGKEWIVQDGQVQTLEEFLASAEEDDAIEDVDVADKRL